MADKSSPPPSPEELARRFIELWQDQMAALSRDPESAGLMNQLLQTQSGAAEAILAATRAFGPGPAGERASAAGTAPRAQAPAAAPDHRGGDVAELARRLERLEERINRLEQGAGAPRRQPRRKPKSPPA